MTFDILQAICWSITYVFLIIYAIKFKTHAIPLIAVCLNFSWETIAFLGSIRNMRFSAPLFMHTAWLFLDLIIVCLYMFYETRFRENTKEKRYFVCGYICMLVCLFVLFYKGYMLLSCFTIDLIMAIAFLRFLIKERFYRSWILCFVGIFKLLGDFFAWLFYRDDPIVNIIGVVVLFCNIIYLIILRIKSVNTLSKEAI